MEELNDLYKELKIRKEDYVFSDGDLDIIKRLLPYCKHRSKEDNFIWLLGGPLLWLFSGRADSKKHKKNNLSKIERKIIAILSNYNYSCHDDYCVLIRKEL